MPRLSPSTLRHAKACHTHLPRLLRECRDIESASNELRWLAEYANSRARHANCTSANARLTRYYVLRRSRGEPLQYILGNQPFGELDILCRKNVLIPRPETELYTTTTAQLLQKLRHQGIIGGEQPLKIVDLCTGTGCIALLLHALLRSATSESRHAQRLDIFGVDLSSHALRLARRNLKHNLENGLLHGNSQTEIAFERMDVLKLGRMAKDSMAVNEDMPEQYDQMTHFMQGRWDVIVSNPPYISTTDYAPGGTVSRSVRDYEPKLALVPPSLNTTTKTDIHQADQFYEAVLHIARQVRTKLLVMEIGDSEQAKRVRGLATDIMPQGALVETWRDDGTVYLHASVHKLQSSARNEHTRRGQTLTVDAMLQHIPSEMRRSDSFVERHASKPTLQSSAHHNADTAHERVVAVWTGAWKEWRLQASSSKLG